VDHIADISVLQVVLRQAALAIRRFGDPAWRASGLARLAASLRDLLERAEAGSDKQLAYANAFAGVATAPGDLDLLSGLLNGSAGLRGLTIDTDMRWRLLHRLVSQGAAGHPQIQAELDLDRTDAGERQAASARAAIPTPEAKTEAWNQIVGGALANATFRATLSGFADPDQDELLLPFAEPYYEVVGRIWADWGSDMAQYFTEGAYPRWVISPAGLDAAESYLSRQHPPAALARLISEGRDDVARSLRCQQRDARS
jgi:aminopeptidase N